MAFKLKATKEHFDETVGIHPTYAEEFTTMKNVKGEGDAKESGCWGWFSQLLCVRQLVVTINISPSPLPSPFKLLWMSLIWLDCKNRTLTPSVCLFLFNENIMKKRPETSLRRARSEWRKEIWLCRQSNVIQSAANHSLNNRPKIKKH